MIQVQLRPLEDTRTPNKSCVYEAVCEVDGVGYAARSRHGAASALARELVTAGIADAAMAVTQRGFREPLTYRSFHRVAQWACEETATKPLHRVRWEDPAVRRARLDAALAAKQGVTVLAGSAAAREVVSTQNSGLAEAAE